MPRLCRIWGAGPDANVDCKVTPRIDELTTTANQLLSQEEPRFRGAKPSGEEMTRRSSACYFCDSATLAAGSCLPRAMLVRSATSLS
jgi:hypothetical protein